MAKLYPPKLDNILPAFTESSYIEVKNDFSSSDYEKSKYYYIKDGAYTLDNSNNFTQGRQYYEKAVVIKIPYGLNSSVGSSDFTNISYIVKSANTNETILTKTVSKDNGSCLIKTKGPSRLFELGQYYKIQMAFVTSSGEVGYYSNIGIARYVKEPVIRVEASGLRNITGIFSDNKTYEKVYNYSFNLYNEFNNLIETSGQKIHNSNYDTKSFESEDHWELQTTLESDVDYFIEYTVTTTGNYSISKKINLNFTESKAPRVDSKLYAENNFEEGYNRIYLKRFIDSSLSDAVKKEMRNRQICGNFYLLRASHKDNYSSWEKLINFQICNWKYDKTNLTLDIYKDYFIEQGTSYKYAIQAYNCKSVYSSKLINDNGPVYSDFEDMFLYDGNRQLKVRFNPKVGTFKPTILESKVDTIGSQYPTFFRNGNVNYKEFQLSGLISLLGDENNEFFKVEEAPYSILEEERFKRELSSYNYQQEREFKLEVLSWLTDGKEKILKTPAEGNYIVRLMNTTLSPNDTLGRMLHTFQTTAYEIANFNLVNLNYFGFIDKSNKIPRIDKKVQLNTVGYQTIAIEASIDKAVIYTAPNTKIQYVFSNGNTEIAESNVFGVLELTSLLNNRRLLKLRTIKQEEEKNADGTTTIKNVAIDWEKGSYIEFSYLNKITNTTNWYYYVGCTVGKDKRISLTGEGIDVLLKSSFNNDSNIVSSFPYIRIQKRTPDYLIRKSGNSYVYNGNGNKVNFSSGKFYQIANTSTYILGSDPKTELSKNSDLFLVKYDGEYLDTNEGELTILRNVSDFSMGKGLVAYLEYPKKSLTIRSDSSDLGEKYYAI